MQFDTWPANATTEADKFRYFVVVHILTDVIRSFFVFTVTDDWDRRCLSTVLMDFYNAQVTDIPKHKLSPSGLYFVPPSGTYDEYVEFIKKLPLTQHPEVFGMHDNVDISKDLQATKLLFDSILLTMGSTAAEGGNTDKKLNDIANDILTKVCTVFVCRLFD
jgi:dynein heavy chain, axonemal